MCGIELVLLYLSQGFKSAPVSPSVPKVQRRESGPPRDIPPEDLFAELGMEAQPSFKSKKGGSSAASSPHRPGTRSSRLSAENVNSPAQSASQDGWLEDEDLDKLIDA